MAGPPPRGVGVMEPQGVVAWELRLNSIVVHALDDGSRKLEITLGETREVMVIPPDVAAHLAALLVGP